MIQKVGIPRKGYILKRPISKNMFRAANENYVPPQNFGEALRRVKAAFGAVGENITSTPGFRLYGTKDGSTVSFTVSPELHKTKGIVKPETNVTNELCNTFAGTALKIYRSETNTGAAESGKLLQMMRLRFFSKPVVLPNGHRQNSIKAVTDISIVSNKQRKRPDIVYGIGKHSGLATVPAEVKRIKSDAVPKKFTGKPAPDGNIVNYIQDTVDKNGNRAMFMRLNEAGLDIQVL